MHEVIKIGNKSWVFIGHDLNAQIVTQSRQKACKQVN